MRFTLFMGDASEERGRGQNIMWMFEPNLIVFYFSLLR